MELAPEQITSELEFFTGKITSSLFYSTSKEGELHREEAEDLRGGYLRLGIFSEEQISKAYQKAEIRVDKIKRWVK